MSAIRRPDFRHCAGQPFELVHSEFHDYLIKPADKTLVRTEHDRTDLSFMRPPVCREPSLGERNRSGLMEAGNQCKFHGAIVVVERLNCFLVLSNARGCQRFHRPNHTFEVPRTPLTSARATREIKS